MTSSTRWLFFHVRSIEALYPCRVHETTDTLLSEIIHQLDSESQERKREARSERVIANDRTD